MLSRFLLVVTIAASLGGCFYGDENAGMWSTPDQIKAAASRCGLSNFEPTKAGDGWAAYVSASVPDHAAKENCIYADLASQGRLTTR
ncbi:hypothetical protein WJU21_14140 [Emcibacter sp. SYSU 3D8]